MSSYGFIVPDLKLLIIVNAQPDDHTIYVDQLLIITGPYTPESAINIQEYEEQIHSMLLDDCHDYKTVLLDGSQMLGDEHDLETAMKIAMFVMQCESRCANPNSDEKIQDHSIDIRANVRDEREEPMCVTNKQTCPVVKEEEICVICLKEFEAGETCYALHECRHWYHRVCIREWLHHENFCPICRESVCSL